MKKLHIKRLIFSLIVIAAMAGVAGYLALPTDRILTNPRLSS